MKSKNNPPYIYHIAEVQTWLGAPEVGEYCCSSLQSEGFIHCSTDTQYLTIANHFFSGRGDLVLLEINTDSVVAPIQYENLEGGSEMYPHIYGPINLNEIGRAHV